MFDAQIERIKLKLDVLEWRDEMCEALSGAAEHSYQLNPPVSEEVVQRLEAKHNLKLPEDYRQFFLKVGNGGAGPYLGLYKIQELKRCGFSSRPEYLEANYESGLGRANEKYWAGMTENALEIGMQDYNIHTLLVVDGPFRGQIWVVNSEAMYDCQCGFMPQVPKELQNGEDPFTIKGKAGVSFLDWYEHWLNAGLKYLEVEI